MIGSIVPQPQTVELLSTGDPLSEVLALLKPESYSSGGFALLGDIAISFPRHRGVKCYAMLAGQCWLVLEGVPEPLRISAGDCFLLPHGRPFRLATDLSIEPLDYKLVLDRLRTSSEALTLTDDANMHYMAGGHFTLTGNHAAMVLESLPPVVHIRSESDKAAMRWSIERMREELREPQPGSALITQQLAYMMLIQAIRLYLTDRANAVPGWLSALSDKHMSVAITAMHHNPSHPWTVRSLAELVGMSRSVFALRFRKIVGTTPLEYLTRWRMLLAADRLKTTSDGLATIARSLGYESESAFGKAFRRTMGASPRQHSRGLA